MLSKTEDNNSGRCKKRRPKRKIVEQNRKAGQNPPRVVAPIEEEEVLFGPILLLGGFHSGLMSKIPNASASSLTVLHAPPISSSVPSS